MSDLADGLRTSLDGRWSAIKENARARLDREDLLPVPDLTVAQARARVLGQLRELVATGYPATGFSVENGGTGDVGASVTVFEMLAYADLSLMVKAGVQWGLFGGAVENLGTERHRAYIPKLISLDLQGCFAMTETGHGSDVQHLLTTATYAADTEEFVVHTPTPEARKDYIGGAAQDARVAAVFAQLVTGGESHGVHCFLVPIRGEDGHDLPGVTTSDCGPKGGLNGVDNGRIVFDQVHIGREALLNRYADVAPDGTYSSAIESPNRRFFTMLGTLIRGRVSVGAAAGAAARLALSIAVRYGLERRQFERPGAGGDEVVILDYRMHQRRLLPLVARAYAYGFAQNQLTERLHALQNGDPSTASAHDQRELEARAAGLKAAITWHATRTVQECREACGGAGYLAEYRLTTLKADTDVFTTFEGDNHVLMQLVAKELLTAYADEVRDLDPIRMARFAATTFADAVRERTAATALIQRLIDARPGGDEPDLLDRGTQLAMFEDREQHVLETAARRLRRAGKRDAFEVFNDAQDHVVRAGRVHVDRVVLEAFVAAIENCENPTAHGVLDDLCSLYALSVVEQDKAWFMEHRRLSTKRAKAVTTLVNELCSRLRPRAYDLVEGFGIPAALVPEI